MGESLRLKDNRKDNLEKNFKNITAQQKLRYSCKNVHIVTSRQNVVLGAKGGSPFLESIKAFGGSLNAKFIFDFLAYSRYANSYFVSTTIEINCKVTTIRYTFSGI